MRIEAVKYSAWFFIHFEQLHVMLTSIYTHIYLQDNVNNSQHLFFKFVAWYKYLQRLHKSLTFSVRSKSYIHRTGWYCTTKTCVYLWTQSSLKSGDSSPISMHEFKVLKGIRLTSDLDLCLYINLFLHEPLFDPSESKIF